MMDVWKSFFLQRTDEWGLPSAGEWKCLFYNNYHAHHSNITLLWFHDREPFPVLITKLFRKPDIPTREFANLQRVYGRAPRWVPRPLYCGAQAGFWTLWMQGVPGWRPREVSADMLGSLAAALTSIHRAMACSPEARPRDRYLHAVVQPLAALSEFGDAPSVHDGCGRLAASVSEQWVDSLPVIPQHGDLYADNVLSSGADWYVIDWESFGAIDLPFYDLFTLLYSLLRRSGDTPETWPPHLSRHLPALVNRYARELQLTTGGLRLLLPLAFANWFHLQWSDGREEFARHMYATMRHYFEHPDVWEAAFFGQGEEKSSRMAT